MLARILFELDLQVSPVGVIALAAGVANDVIGWTLLALALTLAQAGSGRTVAYVIVAIVAWVAFMTSVIRPLLRRTLKLCCSDEGPMSDLGLALVTLMTLISGLFTGMIGDQRHAFEVRTDR